MSEYRKVIVECAFIAKTYIEGLGDQSEDSGIIGRGVQQAILDAFPINDSNPAPVQSAEEFSKKITRKGYDSCGIRVDLNYEDILPLVKSRDAAQRQAGREEAWARYSEILAKIEADFKDQVSIATSIYIGLEKTVRDIRKKVGNMKADNHLELAMALIPLDKALSDLNEARKG